MSDITESTEGTDEATEAPDAADETTEDEAVLGTAYPEDDTPPDEAPADPEPTDEPAEDASPAKLLRGHRGPAVEVLQAALTEAGHPVTVDGYFGTSTGRAVRAFQQAQGYKATGAVGASTAEALGL